MKRVVIAKVLANVLFICGLISFFTLGWFCASCVSVVSKDSVTERKMERLATKILHLRQCGEEIPSKLEQLVARKLCTESDCIDAWGGRFLFERDSDGTILVISNGDPFVGQINPNITSRIICRIKP